MNPPTEVTAPAEAGSPQSDLPSAPAPAPSRIDNVSARQRARMMSQSRRQSAAASTPAPSTNGEPAAIAPTAPPASTEDTPPAAPGTEPTPTPPAPEPAPAVPESPEPTPTETPTPASPAPETPPASGDLEWLNEVLSDPDIKSKDKKLFKRIDELTRNLRTTEARLAEAERARAKETLQPDATPAGAPQTPDLNQMFGSAPEIRQIDSTLNKLETNLTWADENPDGGTLQDTTGNPIEVSATQLRGIRRQWETELSRLNARRETMLQTLHSQARQQRQTAKAQALKLYPWLDQKDSAEFKMALDVVQNYPGISNDPNMHLVLGRYVTGMLAEQGRAKPASPEAIKPPPMTKPRPSGAPAPVVAGTVTVMPRVNPLERQVQDAQQSYEKTGSVKDKVKLLTLRRQLDASRRAVAA